ncbi:hypothetical protein [Microvirga lenta]|uniref:hypothetical protein n=1 Tax=Microvirga lenta TaxID=2881337 RepID=UPI001CFD4965|nr:hypothetical protein [Microvirga lenta]MCB5173721.1 hypothetical protein [Microvirga lenta]
MNRTDAILSKLPDADDALRRLSDVLRVHATCRKRACRREESCQGGYGPPCYFEKRTVFAQAVAEHMHEHRQLWAETRATLRASLRR